MSWRQTAGPTVQLPAVNGASITLTAPNATGQLGFEFSAVDSGGYAATTSVTLTINTPPSLAPIATSKFKVGQAASGSVIAVDPDGDAVTYVLVTGPQGLTLNAETGAWSWTPGTAGTFTMSVMPTDAFGNGTPVVATLNVESSGGAGALTWWLAVLLLLPLARRPSFRPGV